MYRFLKEEIIIFQCTFMVFFWCSRNFFLHFVSLIMTRTLTSTFHEHARDWIRGSFAESMAESSHQDKFIEPRKTLVSISDFHVPRFCKQISARREIFQLRFRRILGAEILASGELSLASAKIKVNGRHLDEITRIACSRETRFTIIEEEPASWRNGQLHRVYVSHSKTRFQVRFLLLSSDFHSNGPRVSLPFPPFRRLSLLLVCSSLIPGTRLPRPGGTSNSSGSCEVYVASIFMKLSFRSAWRKQSCPAARDRARTFFLCEISPTSRFISRSVIPSNKDDN